MIRPLAQAGLNFLVYIYSFREYFIFYFFHERDSETFFFLWESTQDTPGMGQWERRPKADPDPAKSQPVCPGPNGTATAAWAGPHAGRSDDSELLRVIYRAVQLGRASPAHSSLRNSGSSALFFPLFFQKNKNKNAWFDFFFSVPLFSGCGPLVIVPAVEGIISHAIYIIYLYLYINIKMSPSMSCFQAHDNWSSGDV
jgi:hypothetical protein